MQTSDDMLYRYWELREVTQQEGKMRKQNLNKATPVSLNSIPNSLRVTLMLSSLYELNF
jgi:hypothetical protein